MRELFRLLSSKLVLVIMFAVDSHTRLSLPYSLPNGIGRRRSIADSSRWETDSVPPVARVSNSAPGP